MGKGNIDDMITRRELLEELLPGLNALFGMNIPSSKKETKMKTKSKSAQIREAIKTGSKPKAIANRLGVPVNYVYNEKYKMKKATPKKRVVVTKTEANIAKKLNIPLEAYAKEKLKLEENKKLEPTIEQQFYIDELMEIRKQISDLEVIEEFLKMRIKQMEVGSKWQTKAK